MSPLAERIVSELVAGRRVLLVAETLLDGHDVFDEVTSMPIDADTTVVRSNGREVVRHGDAWFRFTTARSRYAGHGLSVDLVLIAVPGTIEVADLWRRLTPCVAGTGGKLEVWA